MDSKNSRPKAQAPSEIKLFGLFVRRMGSDGTKIQGNASRHKAMRYGYMKKEVERRREDIEALVMHAYQQDEAAEAALGSRRGEELPAELARREARLAKMEAARRRLEAEAQAEADAERQRCLEADAERQRSGKKRRGKAPQEIDETPADTAQMSCTDPELHIRQTNNKGGDYCGNAQARVDGAYQSIVACDVTEATNAKQQAEPMGQAILEPLKQAAMALPGTRRVRGTRSRRRGIAVMTAKRQPRPWRP